MQDSFMYLTSTLRPRFWTSPAMLVKCLNISAFQTFVYRRHLLPSKHSSIGGISWYVWKCLLLHVVSELHFKLTRYLYHHQLSMKNILVSILFEIIGVGVYDDCYDELRVPTAYGYLTSPGYLNGSQYGQNIHCYYRLQLNDHAGTDCVSIISHFIGAILFVVMRGRNGTLHIYPQNPQHTALKFKT